MRKKKRRLLTKDQSWIREKLESFSSPSEVMVALCHPFRIIWPLLKAYVGLVISGGNGT